MLRTLPAVYNDPLPLAGTLMSAAQLAERQKAKSLPAPPSHPPTPVLTRKTLPAQQASPEQTPALTQKSLPTQGRALTNEIAPQPSPQPTSQLPIDPAPPTNAASTGDDLPIGPGRPVPATRAEFAAQVLKSVASNPSIPTPLISTKPNPSTSRKSNPAAVCPTTIAPTEKELRSPAEPRQAQRQQNPQTHRQKKVTRQGYI